MSLLILGLFLQEVVITCYRANYCLIVLITIESFLQVSDKIVQHIVLTISQISVMQI